MKHPLSLKSPLPAATLRISALAARQGVCVLDEIELELLSEHADLAPEALLGKPMQVACALRDAAEGVGGCGQRFIGGLCMRFGLGRPLAAASAGERLYAYSASVRPWLWYLTRTSDCRVFQELTVPQIVERVFADFPRADYEFKLVRSYRTRIYCVQYRESDFNFVARLLEDEGIWWYFEHTEGRQRLVLMDDVASTSPVPGAQKLPFMGAAGSGGLAPDVSHIDAWTFSREVQTGKVALQSYDFERPAVSLLAESALVREHELADFEQFDYESESYLKPDGPQRAATRADELASRHERLAGSTNAQALASGHVFALERHPRADQNAKYLCLATQISARAGALEGGGAGADWRCSFSAVPADHAWRPPRQTPKPFVQGPQTAVVVGPAGEEIHTDAYGRVKLQFHWDRYGNRNEKSSCWVRVSSPWAGKSFGFVQLPRIGQEVVVSFLEGDPDQPLITGRVYNAEQMPPWELPANATQSGWLSRSSKGGAYGNANAIRFEDKKGEEQLWLHAEKNQDIEVENDETHWVGHDRTKTVDHDETVHVKHDRTETVDNDETITVHHDRKERVDNDETISIGRDRTETVGADERITIGDNRMEIVGVDETITIGNNRSVTIGGNKVETIARAKAETIALAKALTIGLGYQTSVGAAMNTSVGLSMSEQVGLLKNVLVGQSYTINVGASYTLKATDSIKLEVGQSVLTMKSDGTVTLNGKDINLLATGQIYGEAKDDIQFKGKNVKSNS
jgi:type VI secretion system secreted protein VgrG